MYAVCTTTRIYTYIILVGTVLYSYIVNVVLDEETQFTKKSRENTILLKKNYNQRTDSKTLAKTIFEHIEFYFGLLSCAYMSEKKNHLSIAEQIQIYFHKHHSHK